MLHYIPSHSFSGTVLHSLASFLQVSHTIMPPEEKINDASNVSANRKAVT
jgi:hypothetical protein